MTDEPLPPVVDRAAFEAGLDALAPRPFRRRTM
jgi:hypothetical protein